MLKSCLIVDCYVDEPACFGVPPFISPYPRYIFGALADAGVDPSAIRYATVDDLRRTGYAIGGRHDAVFLVGGAVVPGKYLGAAIGTVPEINSIFDANPGHRFVVGGLLGRMPWPERPNTHFVRGDIEKYAHGLARGRAVDAPRTGAEIARWAPAGAAMIALHPEFPNVICEMETGRGCPRERHCSFCSEGLVPGVEFREIGDILSEIAALAGRGASRFRLGRQADILQYRNDPSVRRNGFPRPDPGPPRELFGELRAMRDAGLVRTLNVDNANPGTIAAFPVESAAILEAIVKSVTPGDTLAMGVESFDPAVAALNDLKADAAGVRLALRAVNEIGGGRVDGIPVLLPGVNLLHGLRGETPETFRINHRELVAIRDEGLLVKRINIRTVLPFPGTAMAAHGVATGGRTELRYRHFRERIRKDVELAMTREIYPPGTVLRDVVIREGRPGYSLGKQIASYSITARVPGDIANGTFLDAIVVGHRERSVTALPVPVMINELPASALALIPGVGKKKAGDIVLRRPFSNVDEALPFFEGVDAGIIGAFSV